MNKDEFTELYNKKTIKDLCLIFNCSTMTIYRTLKRYEIPLKGCKNNKRSTKINIGD